MPPRSGSAAKEDAVVKKIALEEHFLCPGFIEYWDPTVAGMPAAKRENLLNRNTDFGEMRLASPHSTPGGLRMHSSCGMAVESRPVHGAMVLPSPFMSTLVRPASSRRRSPR